jgi:uncharacterized protein
MSKFILPEDVLKQHLVALGKTGSGKSSALRYIVERGDQIIATKDGVNALGDFEPLPTGDALRDYWLQRLGGGEKTILQVLVGQWPNAVSRESLDEPTGYQRSSRNTYLQRLSSRRLIESIGGDVKASDQLFDAAVV